MIDLPLSEFISRFYAVLLYFYHSMTAYTYACVCVCVPVGWERLCACVKMNFICLRCPCITIEQFHNAAEENIIKNRLSFFAFLRRMIDRTK